MVKAPYRFSGAHLEKDVFPENVLVADLHRSSRFGSNGNQLMLRKGGESEFPSIFLIIGKFHDMKVITSLERFLRAIKNPAFICP